MSDRERPPPADADRVITDYLEVPDPEAPTDDLVPDELRDDADREVTEFDDLLEENGATSPGQPSEDLP
jgi:hypothetical protein